MPTTLMPLDPAMDPARITRILTISANLLPDEIIAGRRAHRTRGMVLAALSVVLVLLGGWYWHAAAAKGTAEDELAATTAEVQAVRVSQRSFQPVVQTKAQSEAIDKQLKTLLANDMPWDTMLNTLRGTGSRAGVTVTGVTGTLNSAKTAGGAAPVPGTESSVGALQITGTARDNAAIARYVDSLATLETVASPYLTSVAKGDKNLQFTLSAGITAKALCGRFTTACTSTGGN